MWHDVPGYEDHLQVTRDGRIRTKDRRTWTVQKNRSFWQHIKGREITGTVGTHGYVVIGVPDPRPETKAAQTFVGLHVLMCLTFHGPKPSRTAQALHRNDVKTDNRESSLYWGTAAQNGKDRVKNRRAAAGSAHGMAKLADEDVAEIRALYKPKSRTHGAFALAKLYGVHRTSIENIVRGSTWQAPKAE